jgi:hypothetical protein
MNIPMFDTAPRSTSGHQNPPPEVEELHELAVFDLQSVVVAPSAFQLTAPPFTASQFEKQHSWTEATAQAMKVMAPPLSVVVQ